MAGIFEFSQGVVTCGWMTAEDYAVLVANGVKMAINLVPTAEASKRGESTGEVLDEAGMGSRRADRGEQDISKPPQNS